MSSPIGIAALALIGALLGVAADRLSVRWPAHEDGYTPRSPGWRTGVLALAGAAVFGGLVARWGEQPVALLVLLGFSAALLVLLATDLDQRLLPDQITLPLIGYSTIVLVAGWSPLLGARELGFISGVAAGVGAPAFLLVTDRLLRGDLGSGDVKLAVSVGLLTGVSLLVTGLVTASVAFAVLLLGLMAARKIGLRSAVPFGPVLIGGAFVAVLVG